MLTTLVRHPSLYLRFLPNHLKDVGQPDIAFTKLDVGGCYYRSQEDELEVGDRTLDLHKGLLLIDETDEDDVIAHEWRHHQQAMNGIVYDGIGWDFQNDYWEQLKRYFTQSDSEMDALLFGWRMSDYLLESWKETLQLSKKWSKSRYDAILG